MLTLQTLGRVRISGSRSDAAALSAQPRRLALLVYIATEPLGRNRDVIQAMFWPEQSPDRARHALNQSLHVLRRILGPDAVESSGRTVRINPDIMTCDVVAFMDRLPSDRTAALDFYHGEFLAGFFISGAPDFERWADEMRQQLRTAATDAALRLSDEHDALVWARRARAIAPENEEAVRREVTALANRGDVGGALRAYDGFVRYLQAEYDLAPSDETIKLADELRARPKPALNFPALRRYPKSAAAILVFALFGIVAASSPAGFLQNTLQRVASRRAFARAEREQHDGRYASALTLYQQALRDDSTFSLARYRIALTALPAEDHEVASLPELQRVVADSAVAEKDRRLAHAAMLWLTGDALHAEIEYRRVLSIFGDDAEAWYMLGETLFHYNPMRGRGITEARDAFEQALRLDADHWQARWHLALLRLYDGDRAQAIVLLQELLATNPEPRHALDVRTLLASAQRDTIALRGMRPEMRRASEYWLLEAAWRAAVYAHDQGAAQYLSDFLIAPERTDYAKLLGRRLRAALSLSGNDAPQAIAEAIAADSLTTGFIEPGKIRVQAQIAIHPSVKLDRSRLLDLRRRLQHIERTPESAYLVARLSLLLHESESVRTTADSLLRAQASDSLENHRLGHALRAHLYAAAGDNDSALSELQKIETTPWYGWAIADPRYSLAPERALRAQLLRSAHRLAEADLWSTSLQQNSVFDLAYANAIK